MIAAHAHSWVVIDCRVPQESVIRIVSTMGTKKSISYKMISHGSWYSQIEKGRERETAKTQGRERKGNRQVNKRGRNHTRKNREKQRVSVCGHHNVRAKRE